VADQQYNGEFRYVNLGPAQVRARLESETDELERVALTTALEFWTRKSPGREVSAGQPYRGEKREAVYAKSMAALASQVKPVEHVFVGPCLSIGGKSSGTSTGTDSDGDIFDFEMLTSSEE